MIQTKMLIKVKKQLPLKIEEILWDGTVFQIYGSTWNFTTLSAWRISTKTKMVLGCFDKDSMRLISDLKSVSIVDIDIQSNSLTIDPVFILSDGQKIEIFSTDTYEPWTFQTNDSEVFVATPSDPDAFNEE